MSLFVYVHVHPRKTPSDLHSEDSEVAGVYEVELDPEVPRDGLVMAALDGLSDQLSIKAPEDFTRTVRLQGGELVAAEGIYEADQLLGYVLSVEKTLEPSIDPDTDD